MAVDVVNGKEACSSIRRNGVSPASSSAPSRFPASLSDLMEKMALKNTTPRISHNLAAALGVKGTMFNGSWILEGW